MKKKNKSSVQQFNYILSTISQCDVVLRNGNKQFIGLYYDSEKADAPYILCKEAASLSYCMYKYLETIGVLCVDNALLTKEIFENVQEGDLLPPVYFDRVAVIYSNLAKYKDTSKESFHIKLNKDVVYQINRLEKDIYKRTIKRNKKKETNCLAQNQISVESYLEEGITALPDCKKMRFETFYNESYHTTEYYLSVEIRKFSIEYCLCIFVSKKEGLIYICTPASIETFKINETDKVLYLVKELSKSIFKELIRDTEKYCKEFEINLRLYEIARNTMETMLKMNYNQNGIEYGFSSDTTVFQIYLRNKEKNTMYRIVITYKEFLRNPNIFKEFIRAPHKIKKWNFWCNEKKYKPEYFDKKFQPEIS